MGVLGDVVSRRSVSRGGEAGGKGGSLAEERDSRLRGEAEFTRAVLRLDTGCTRVVGRVQDSHESQSERNATKKKEEKEEDERVRVFDTVFSCFFLIHIYFDCLSFNAFAWGVGPWITSHSRCIMYR